MRPELRRELRLFGVGAACGFLAGALVVALVVWQFGDRFEARTAPERATAPRPPDRWQDGMGPIDRPAATATSGTAVMEDAGKVEAVRELMDRDLDIPVEGVDRDDLTRSFRDARSGDRTHEALDILAPRNTPVKAVEDGRIAKLFNSKAGGITIYQFDPSERFCYYYAHLEKYADAVREGERVRKGQVIGYVGTSGNAPKDTPHLHFAVFRLSDSKRWWEGTPLDPFDVLQ